jgi:hypothetical protein
MTKVKLTTENFALRRRDVVCRTRDCRLRQIRTRRLPVVVEIVDTPEKIDAWLPVIQGLLSGGLVTIEHVQVLEGGSVPTDKPTTRRA